MSVKAANDFIERANRDESVRKEARDNFKDVVNVGRKHGYDFTHDELTDAFRQRKSEGKDDGSYGQCAGHFGGGGD